MSPFKNLRVLVTGHSGFKGRHVCAALRAAGAEVFGYACDPAPINSVEHEKIGDIRDAETLNTFMQQAAPSAVLHLAAQALVLPGYADPLHTFSVNVQGTAEVCAAALRARVSAVLAVTSDKVYANHNTGRPFVEGDPLGGDDPYSASKAAAEHVVHAYRLLGLCVASARAGNVVGADDTGAYRLLPDIRRAAERGEAVRLRAPDAVRPWHDIDDCVTGYLKLTAALLQHGADFAEAFNFGPASGPLPTVLEAAQIYAAAIGAPEPIIEPNAATPPEAGLLRLNTDKALRRLGHTPKHNGLQALQAAAVASARLVTAP